MSLSNKEQRAASHAEHQDTQVPSCQAMSPGLANRCPVGPPREREGESWWQVESKGKGCCRGNWQGTGCWSLCPGIAVSWRLWGGHIIPGSDPSVFGVSPLKLPAKGPSWVPSLSSV